MLADVARALVRDGHEVHVVCSRGGYAGGPASRAMRTAARGVYRSADRIISLGSCMTERLSRAGVGPARIATVHNWVPGESVRPVPLDRTDDRFLVMYSGNMGMGHEFETMLDAAAMLRGDRSVEFRFVGGGKRRAEVEAGASRRSLDNVRFMEPVPLGGLSALLGSAGVHLLSMRPGLEGMLVPSKVYGILAASRPAVMVGSTENEAARLLRSSGAGFVIPVGDAAGLCRAVGRLKDEPGLARSMGRAGRLHYDTRLGRDRSVAAIARELTGARVLPLPLLSGIMPASERRRRSA